jgi:LPXTG-site transpeptidase (sortase) family protein
MIRWLRTFIEWSLVGIGCGCLGSVGYVAVQAALFERAQAAAVERAIAGPAPRERVVTLDTGALIGLLTLPRVGLSTAVVEGDDSGSLRLSAGHLPDTPLPWYDGNSAIAGHRDGRFGKLRNVKVGDEVRLRTPHGEIRYVVRKLSVVEPDDLSVLDPHDSPSLTLITCYPFTYIGNAPHRFIVRAERLSSADVTTIDAGSRRADR